MFGSQLLHVLVVLHYVKISLGGENPELVASNRFGKCGLYFLFDNVFDLGVGYRIEGFFIFGCLVVGLSVDFSRDACDIRRQLLNAIFYHSHLASVG